MSSSLQAGIEFAITSGQIFDLPQFPQRLVVAGAGYIAIELAWLFAGLGREVAIGCRRDNVLRGFDPTPGGLPAASRPTTKASS
jgi:pyruvate/2-oxoglutarate dehydrogenase complex dihydrolipoamide dehydrogenase (E3) component